jgi:hypothetical protein
MAPQEYAKSLRDPGEAGPQSKAAWRERAGAIEGGSAASFRCRASPLGSSKPTVLLSDAQYRECAMDGA